MKKSTYSLLLIVVICIIYFGSLFFDLHKSKNRKDVIYSPDKNKSVSFFQATNQTSLMLNFHKMLQGGSGLGNFSTDSSNLSIVWIDNHLLEIRYPQTIDIAPKEEVFQYFKDSVVVRYVEK